VLVSTVPASGVSIIPGLTQISVTFDEEIFAVTTENIRIYVQGNPTPIINVPASSGTKSGNTYTYDFPAITTLGSYYVIIDQYAFDDQWANSYDGIVTPTGWTFEIVDNEAPVITHTEVTSFEKGGGSVNYSIGVTDNVAATNARMIFRKIGGQQTYDSITMVVSGGQAQFQVTESMLDEMGIEYYFKANDVAGNVGRSPSGTGSYHSYLNRTGSNVPSLPNFTPGGDVSNYKIISVPFIISNRSINEIFKSLLPQDKQRWRVLTYRADPDPGQWLDYPSTIDRGKGYFINVKDVLTESIKLADSQSPSNNTGSPFTMNLTSKFNLIGNPYPFSIRWQDVVDANPGAGIIDPPKTFSNGSYSTVTTIGAFEGAFVYSEQSVSSLIIPVKNASGARVEQPQAHHQLDHPEWQLELTLAQGMLENKLSGIGMNPEAKVTRDKFDQIAPPRFIDYLELNFSHPEHAGKWFCWDVVPYQDEYVWDITIASNLSGLAELKWDNTGFGNNVKELFLFDVSRQKIVNMRGASSYILILPVHRI
ncbi:MAG: Ig-like domain-containing protein, partial [Flammeovirgaceae bacterium]|nr:Ig-like domain-containing protein [Flammeovirgaceae bacterium]